MIPSGLYASAGKARSSFGIVECRAIMCVTERDLTPTIIVEAFVWRGPISAMTSSFFQAYLDESGTHKGSSILAVAGYFGTQSQWDKYLKHWPHREFHARESRFDQLKPQLVEAIDRAELSGVECCLRPWEFKEFASQHVKSSIGNAYVISAFMCATRICGEAQQLNADARIAFVIEDGQPNVEWLQRLLIIKMQDFPIASVTVASKSGFSQLHTADFLAHSRSTTNTQWLDRLFANKRVWEQQLVQPIFEAASVDLAELFKRYRNRRAKEKTQRRLGQTREKEI
jgi:hypothetical protein